MAEYVGADMTCADIYRPADAARCGCVTHSGCSQCSDESHLRQQGAMIFGCDTDFFGNGDYCIF